MKLYLTLKFKFSRTAKGWTQQQFADYLSVHLERPISRQLVHALEHGQRAINDTDAMKLSSLLGISYKDLVERK